MSDCCEKYTDFIAICSFLNVFGPQLEKKGENKIPTASMLKHWLEHDTMSRSHRTRINQLLEFLLRLLSTFTIGGGRSGEKCTKVEDVNKFLISFTMSHGMSKQSTWLRDYGFDMICIKEKLAILRRLLEFQLDQNKNVIESASLAKGPDIRHEPIGRDCQGNYYWHFVEGKSSLIVKELLDSSGEPFCQVIRNQAGAHQLIKHIKQCKVGKVDWSSMKVPEKLKKGQRPMALKCGMCKKQHKWHEIRDEALRFDNQEWFCPDCEQKQLLNAVADLFFSEE